MPSVKEWLLGSDDKMKKLPTGTPEQGQFHSDILGQLKQLMNPGGGYDLAQQYHNNILQPGQEGFQQFLEPYLQQFQEQIAPRIAEQFAGAGALSSSGFGQALGGAGAGLQSQLAQLFQSLQQNSAGAQTNQYNQQSQQFLNHQPFAYERQKGSAGLLGPLLGAFSAGVAGPAGAAGAGGIESLFKKMFGQG